MLSGKLNSDDEEALSSAVSSLQTTELSLPQTTEATTPFLPTRVTPKMTEANKTSNITSKVETQTTKPKARLLNLNIEDLNPFNILQNHTDDVKVNKKILHDLSDVNLDGDDDEDFNEKKDLFKKPDRIVPDNFYSNLQSPFHPLNAADRVSEEIEMCKENGVSYRVSTGNIFIYHLYVILT